METKKPVENVLEETMRHLKSIIDVNTVVGKPIIEDGATIIPISKVSLGFVSGGGEYNNNKKKRYEASYPFAGGSGGGCNITPIGFLVIVKDNVQFIKVNHENNFEKVIDVVSDFVKKIK